MIKIRSTLATRRAAGGHAGLFVKNGSNSTRTPLGDAMRKVECPSHVTFRPCSACGEMACGSADGNRIAGNYPLRFRVPKSLADLVQRSRFRSVL